MSMFRRIFKYIEPLWLGNDGKISLRSVAAIALTIDFIRNVHNTSFIVTRLLNLICKDKTVDPALVSSISGNLAQIAIILGLEAALLTAALALKTYQNNVFKQLEVQNTPQVPVEESK